MSFAGAGASGTVISSAATSVVSFAGSGSAGVDVEFGVVGCSIFVRSGVEELTDIGGSGSRILDGEEGTEIGVAAAPDWLNGAKTW